MFDVDVFDESGRKSTVPVSWRGLQGDMPPELLDLDIGDDVVVSGVMGRRFIGASGFLVDVRADEVVGGGKVRRRNAVKRVLTAALDAA